MKGIRCTAYVALLHLLVWLGNPASIQTCLGGDKPPGDLVLFRSFAIPPDGSGAPLMAHRLSFSENGELLACFCNARGFPGYGDVYLWDIKTGKCVRQIRPFSEWEGVVLRPNGPIEFPYYFTTQPYARLCFRTATGLELRDDLCTSAKKPILLKSLDGSAEIEQQSVYFSTDDKYVAAVRKDDKSVNVWNTRDGERLRRFVLPNVDTMAVRSMAFGPANRYLAAGADDYVRPGVNGGVIVWDLETGQEVLHTEQEQRVFQVAFSTTGDLICGEGRGGPYGLDESGRITMRKAGEFDDPRTIHTPCGVLSIAVVPRLGIVTGDWHGQVLLWNPETGRLLAVAKENGREVLSLAVGQDGRLVASGDSDSLVRLWRITGGESPK